MLELRFVREHLDLVRQKSQLRGLDPQILDRFAQTDGRRLIALAQAEALKNERNTVSRTIAAMKQRFPGLEGDASLELSAKVAKGEMKWP